MSELTMLRIVSYALFLSVMYLFIKIDSVMNASLFDLISLDEYKKYIDENNLNHGANRIPIFIGPFLLICAITLLAYLWFV